MLPDWINHIELVVLASLIVLIVSSFCNSVIACTVQKWILKHDCGDCPTSKKMPEVEHNQAKLRQETLPNLMVDIAEIKGDIKTIVSLLKQAKVHYEDAE